MTAPQRTSIVQEARRLGVDTLYSEKAHFMAARHWKSLSYSLSIPSAALAALAGAAFFKGAYKDFAGWLAVAASALAAVGTALNPSDHALRHQRAGIFYAALRREIRQFVQVDVLVCSEDRSLSRRLQELIHKVSKLQGDSPSISEWAYKRAKKSIDEGSAEYTEGELSAATGDLPDTEIGLETAEK